ncbi:Ribokinase-like protein, partial [Periconia macrospinosa]
TAMATQTSPDISCVSLGMVIIDDIFMPDRLPLTDVLGGSASFVTFGQRLFASVPAEVGCLVIAGDDFPSKVRNVFGKWGVSLVTKVRAGRKSSRGTLVYKDTTFGPKTFEYNGEPLRATPDDLADTPLLHAKAIHLFGSPKEILVQVPQLLQLRARENINIRPFIVWEPLPSACTKVNREAILSACKLVDVFSPNHLEVAAIFEDAPQDFDSQRLEGYGRLIVDSSVGPEGGGVVVIRSGEHGAMALSRAMRPVWLPSYHEQGSSKVVDPTGAGNTFLGGYIAGWQKTRDICEAIKFGHVAASFALEQIGLPTFSHDEGQELCNGVVVSDRLQDYKNRLSRAEVNSEQLV